MEWFTVDKEGLADLIKRRGAAGAVVELVQNAFDTEAKNVTVSLETTGRMQAHLQVTDDDPNGFIDLAHAFTLFAASSKKSQAEKRGRFNLGEKLVLALCSTASIASTKGTVSFDAAGRHENSKARTDVGSIFDASIRLSVSDIRDVETLVHRIFIPDGVTFSYNGTVIEPRKPEREWDDTLPTEIADEEGILKPTRRRTSVRLYTVLPGEEAHLYELGIPVVEIDAPFHVDVGQKIPLNFERNNVTPSYLRAIHLTVANHAVDAIAGEEAAKHWVNDALSNPRISPEAVEAIVSAKYGVPSERLVRYDPSDREAMTEAQSQGFVVVPGGTFSKPQWENINRAELLPAAGQVTPSRNRILETLSGAKPEEIIPESDWRPSWVAAAEYAKAMAVATLGCSITVRMVRSEAIIAGTGTCYSATFGSRTLTFNAGKLFPGFWTDQEAIDRLLIHEFAHHTVADHLDHRYHETCCRLGARFRAVEHRLTHFSLTVAAGS